MKLLLSGAVCAALELVAWMTGGLWGVLVVTGFGVAIASPLVLLWTFCTVKDARRDRARRLAEIAVQAVAPAGRTVRSPDLDRPASGSFLTGRHRKGGGARLAVP
jgi:hypothetical protein